MKKLVSLILAFVLCLSLSLPAFAAAADAPEKPGIEASADDGEPTRYEETEWYYRITDDGLVQRRLWSITYGYWKTDWITIGHV